MKKITALVLSVILCCGLLFGCGNSAVSNQTSPKDVKNVKWTTYDYSFSFDTTKDCKGIYSFDTMEYNVTVNFDGSHITVVDNDKKDAVLWTGMWQYKDDKNKKLYVYGIKYNVEDYEELSACYTDFMDMRAEKVK